MYTIFINDFTLHITKNAPAMGTVKTIEGDKRIWLDANWKEFSNKVKNGRVYIVTDDPDELWNLISTRYKLIEAAGGLVTNSHGEILFIERLGKWDLPKGKLEEGEDIRECALREVEEECGITGHSIVEDLPNTYHTYKVGDVPVLKRTYWYWMRVDGQPELTPQTEEDITQTVWLKEKDWKMVEKNTYPSIKSLLETYRFRYK
ncbi:MAG: NUDIX domain-containing protein [Flavobacteriia bacterium]|nr:NUDIX domain-containing protein [Flavobacteriia bacterium]